jgi:phosphoenolpyruvate-protein kinase (PTS system EI component)
MAADPLGAAALAALQVDALSVPVNQFAAARQALGQRTVEELAALRPRLLAQRTIEGVRAVLREGRPHEATRSP